jgi:hypothetical protein
MDSEFRSAANFQELEQLTTGGLTSRTEGRRPRQPLGLAWRQRRVHTSNRSAPLSYRGIGSGRRFDLRQDQRETRRLPKGFDKARRPAMGPLGG